jgi:hypothetical protein
LSLDKENSDRFVPSSEASLSDLVIGDDVLPSVSVVELFAPSPSSATFNPVMIQPVSHDDISIDGMQFV